MEKDQVLFLILFYFVLSLGCFWQILNVCKLYFNYPTNVFINTIFEPFSKPLPAITFCTNIGEPNNSGLNSLDALEAHSRKFKYEMFRSIEIQGESGYKRFLKNEYLENAIERTSLGYYCITLNSLITGNKSTELKWNEKIHIKFQKYGRYGWWLYLHNSFDIPSSYSWNAIQIKQGFQHRVSWKLGAFRLLESPYPTNCKDYKSSTEYLSRRDCIRNCKLNVSLTQCKAIYVGIDMGRVEPSVPFGDKDCEKCITKIDFDTICGKRCSHYDCVIDYYELVLLFESDCTHYKGCAWVDITIPTKPETAYHHEPRIETVEFVCYLASTFSMWFGLSMYSLYYLFTICCNRIVNQGKSMTDISKVSTKMFQKTGVSNQKFAGTRKMGRFTNNKQARY